MLLLDTCTVTCCIKWKLLHVSIHSIQLTGKGGVVPYCVYRSAVDLLKYKWAKVSCLLLSSLSANPQVAHECRQAHFCCPNNWFLVFRPCRADSRQARPNEFVQGPSLASRLHKPLGPSHVTSSYRNIGRRGGTDEWDKVSKYFLFEELSCHSSH